ncbi:MAG: response regulator transcription factor [Saprospiraceae bacterium]|nr:response regulator transcription factor [Saprospiraceae bacterium]
MSKIRIAIADDEQLFILGLKMILEFHPDIEVKFLAPNGKLLLDKLKQDPEIVDIILLDLEMPVLDGVDALLEIVRNEYPIKVIILTSHYNDGMIIKLLDEGAAGFLAKNENPDIVIDTIVQVHQRGFYINNYILQLIRNRRLFAKRKTIQLDLTKRETEILKMICEENTNKEIADKLKLSARTIEGHRQKILEKTGCKNTVGLVIYAIEHHIIDVHISRYN